MLKHSADFKNIPAVNTILAFESIKEFIATYSRSLVLYAIHKQMEAIKTNLDETANCQQEAYWINVVEQQIFKITQNSLRPVINAAGIIIHTNLGRLPFTLDIIEKTKDVLSSYNNLEFDLQTGTRGSREVHIVEKIKYLTGAEDVLVVNNNAAAVMLILRTFAKDKEVVISRSELVEIGGSFRMPDIMKAADCIMNEIGTTNKTKIEDYKKAINKRTGLLLKVHQSNFVIKGFTTSCTIHDISELGKKNKLLLAYDLGSGLLDAQQLPLSNAEATVNKALLDGADMVCFSGDKLLGGPQAGIIVGKKKCIEKLRKAPLYRALRVDKLTITYLENTCNTLIIPQKQDQNFLYHSLHQSKEALHGKAVLLQQILQQYEIKNKIIEESGAYGGGTMPETALPSFAVQIQFTADDASRKKQSIQAEKVYKQLLQAPTPVLPILKKGKLLFNVLCLQDKEIQTIADTLKNILHL